MSTHKLAILIDAIGAERANQKLKGIDKTLSSIGARAGKGIRTAGANIERLGVVAGGIAAAGLVAAVKAASDFEAELNTIATIVPRTQLPKIGTDLRNIAKQTGIGLDELSSAYYDLVSAGVKAADATSVLTDATHLAIGGLGSTTETIDLLTTAMNAYGLSAKGVTSATDMFAQAIADGKVKAADIAATFSQVAALAKAFGVGIDQVAASYGYLTAQGVPAEGVTTEMARAIQDIVKPSNAAEKAMKKLAKASGINFQRMLKTKGLVPTLEAMRIAAEKAGVPFQELFGRKEGLLFALQTTGPAFKGFMAELDRVKKSAGEANKQFAERQQGLNFQLGRLKALAIDAGITIGAKLLPKITPLADRAVKFLEVHQDDISSFGDTIASAFDKAATFAEKIPWGTIGQGLKTAADWSAKLFDVFLSLPPQVQTTLIALAGLNKLSGGAIGGIIGELGKGLIKGVLGMNAGVVNIKAGVVTGGGGGVVGAAEGGMGLLSKVFLGSALAVSIIGISAEVADALGFKGERQKLADTMGLTNLQALALQIQQRGGLGSMDLRSRQGALQQFLNAHTTYDAELKSALAQVTQVQKTAITQSNAHSDRMESNIVSAIVRKNLAVTIPVSVAVSTFIGARETSKVQTTRKVYSSGSAGKYAL